jgi:hypothetical protein
MLEHESERVCAEGFYTHALIDERERAYFSRSGYGQPVVVRET